MRSIVLFILLFASSVTYAVAQNLSGAYLFKDNDNKHLILIADGYITHSIYTEDTYESTQGGTFKIDNNNLTVLCEFDDQAPGNIGKTHNFQIATATNGIYIDGVLFEKQAVKKQALDGLWRITGRKVNNNIQTIPRADRKTIKILVDGYFQWIAINPAEKGFYGTGGGQYTFNDGTYQENILFFSRDNSRIGAALNFNGKVENQTWHHNGKSSKGDPIYEIWTRENNE